MMRHLGIDLEVKADKQRILAALRANRETHAKMVAEARAGYLDAAAQLLRERLAEITAGKAASLRFSLPVPLDYTRVYDTTIGQLELHADQTITLRTSEYNMLVEDEWEWVREFAKANVNYSGSTRAWVASKGFEVE